MHQPIFRFRGLRLDPATRQLTRDGVRIPLPLKSFDCLTYLIQHRNRAVGRDELIAAVWGRAEVSDKLLGQTLLRARRAIGEEGGEQTAIRTLPRFGYHWEEPVELEAPTSASSASLSAVESDRGAPSIDPESVPALDEADPSSAPIAPARRRPARRSLLFAASAVLVALAAISALRFLPDEPISAPPPLQERLVLVLPVSGMRDGEESWIRLGAMDYLASRLRKVQGLQVLPSEQTVALIGRDGATDPRGESDLYRLGRMTGASYILAPRATHAGSNWNVTLDVFHDRGTRSFEAQAPTPLQASMQVANLFVASLSLPAPGSPEPPSSPNEYLQRIDAALLAADLAQARRLADMAPAELQKVPAFVVRAGRIAFRGGEVDKAEQLLRTLDRADASVPAEIRAEAVLGLGAIAFYREDFAAADRHFTQVIAALGESVATASLGKAYMQRGVVRGLSNQVDAAMADFGRARVELERTGDRLGTANLDINQGFVEMFRNRLPEAVAAYDRAIATFTRFGINDNLVIALASKSSAQRLLLDLDAALSSSDRQMVMIEHLRNPVLARTVVVSRVPLLLDLGRLSAADELIRRYLPDSTKAADDPVFAVMGARLRIAQGRSADALQDADAVLDAVERQPSAGNGLYLSGAVETYVDAALRAGRAEQAARFLERLRAAPALPQDGDRAFVLELCIARVQAAKGAADAAAHFEKALTIADSRGPASIVAVSAAYADHLLAGGDRAATTAILGRLLPYAARSYDAARIVDRLYTALGDAGLAEQANAAARRLAGERPVQLP